MGETVTHGPETGRPTLHLRRTGPGGVRSGDDPSGAVFVDGPVAPGDRDRLRRPGGTCYLVTSTTQPRRELRHQVQGAYNGLGQLPPPTEVPVALRLRSTRLTARGANTPTPRCGRGNNSRLTSGRTVGVVMNYNYYEGMNDGISRL